MTSLTDDASNDDGHGSCKSDTPLQINTLAFNQRFAHRTRLQNPKLQTVVRKVLQNSWWQAALAAVVYNLVVTAFFHVERTRIKRIYETSDPNTSSQLILNVAVTWYNLCTRTHTQLMCTLTKGIHDTTMYSSDVCTRIWLGRTHFYKIRNIIIID